MLELPEANVLAGQIMTALRHKQICKVTVGRTKHKFAWYYGRPDEYGKLLEAQAILNARAVGGFVEIDVGKAHILFGEGINLRYCRDAPAVPAKHQLLLELDNGSYLAASVQMYGGLGCFTGTRLDNPYYQLACERPSPLADEFDEKYFGSLLAADNAGKLSLKALLATEQRIPGLGNGVLQDILFNAGLNPKVKVQALTRPQVQALFKAVKSTLKEMIKKGGRDTEKDLFGNNGGYVTKMSKNTAGKPCSSCGTPVTKASYMGGSVYYCGSCQPG